MQNNQSVDILDIVFAGKNKAYGAYVLRKKYNRNLSIALWSAILLILLATLSPQIIAFFKPKETNQVHVKRVSIATLSEISQNAKKEDAPPPKVEAPPIKSTVRFTVPVIKPDNMVRDEYVPTVDELKDVDPGKKTVEGNPQGVDESLYKVETQEQKEEKVTVEEKKEKAEVFTYVEEMPSFPGGQDAMLDFVHSNIEYPEIAKRVGVEGKVFVTFVVTSAGKITNVAVAKGIGAGCDEEAVKVIRKMPNWNPGKQNGAPVNVQVSIPIFFQLK